MVGILQRGHQVAHAVVDPRFAHAADLQHAVVQDPLDSVLGAQIGITLSASIAFSSCGTPGMQRTSPRASPQMIPGAVPLGLGMIVEPEGAVACFLLFSVMGRRMNAKRFCSSSSSSGRISSGCLNTSDTASRVRSSSVGPSPPDVSTHIGPIQCRFKHIYDPAPVVADGSLLIKADAVLGKHLADVGRVDIDNLPSSSSVPIITISAFMGILAGM